MLLTNWTVPSWAVGGSGSSRRARVAVVDVAGPAPGPGPGQAQEGLAGPALAPGPAPSLATDPGGLETGTFQVEVQVWSQEVKKPQPLIRMRLHLLRSRISGINASLDYLLSKTIDSVTSMFLFFELYNLK